MFHRLTVSFPSILAVLAAALLVVSACAAVPEGEGDAENPYGTSTNSDPIEGFNRGVFAFNEVVDNVLLKPVARIYRGVVPQPGREGVRNFLNNLASPVIFLNCVLQGDPQQAFTTLWRFVLNTTFGIAGVFDFAEANTNLHYRSEDFGQTMGVYGAGSGAYVVLPILGPSSARDTVGKVVDIFTDPFNYIDSNAAIYARAGLVAIDSREASLDVVDEIYRTSLDPYATIRSAYLQRREAEVNNMKNRKKMDPSLSR